MSYDEMELDMVGDQRTALFIIISDTDDTFNFVVAMMYSQLFNLLCDRADDVHHGRLPYHVRILCDEFANSDDTFYAENGRNNRQKRSLKSQII